VKKEYEVYAFFTATKVLGAFEADTKEDAIKAALNKVGANVNLCHQCAREIDVGDCYEFQADEV